MSEPDPRPVRAVPVAARLLRGYGPLAAFAAFLLAISVLVPSKVPEKVSAGGESSSTDDGSSGPIGSSDGPGGVVSGASGATGGAGGEQGSGEIASGGGAAVVEGCDRKEQVPGDPYSPPCVAFTGDNGGATSKGVTADEINVAFRVLNEKGFQQTLAELAGAIARRHARRHQAHGRARSPSTSTSASSSTAARSRSTSTTARARTPPSCSARAATRPRPTPPRWPRRSAPSPTCRPPPSPTPTRSPTARRHRLRRPVPVARVARRARARTSGASPPTAPIVAEFAAEYAVKRLVRRQRRRSPAARSRASPASSPRWRRRTPGTRSRCRSPRRRRQKAGCDAGRRTAQYQLDLGTMSNQATNIIAAAARAQGVTTILCGCDPIIPVFLSGVANRENYYPEFIIVGTALTDTDIVGQLWNQDFAKPRLRRQLARPSFVPPTADDRLRGLQVGAPGRAGVLRRPHLLPDVHAGDRPPDGRARTSRRRPSRRACSPTRRSSGRSGSGASGRATTRRPDDVREIYWDPNAISTYNGKQGALHRHRTTAALRSRARSPPATRTCPVR